MVNKTLNITETLMEKIKALPEEKQEQILDYVEFIEQKYNEEKAQPSKKRKKRVMGLHKGKIWMSDDFNEPLELVSSGVNNENSD
ncbi:MAG: DUF2281 domain-containing protein [Gomphosphaeria aponina SAG 52.96 = DSM 107014]|uniref:DUF2281 domain-containing protein n=1 Tax=Gomphosphaeria aponina SAG 52.96 = DSM 107014 TaxID=1521640 RepID=A0A941GTA0_9CHRO|nr:DUF2281 domain-containing protein [Gomphosphaeria aponina SAG 52.96 = DSM 107014]